MIPDDAMEFTISPRATVNHGRLLPRGFRMHNRLVVTYDITSYSEMITEIPTFWKQFNIANKYQGRRKKERSVGSVSVSGNGTPIVFRP